MPRGIPNAKRDDKGMRFTTFNVPLASNPKNVGSNYLKNDQQTIWGRNAARKNRPEETAIAAPEGRRGSQVLVIHPGSRFTRVGKASDVNPVSIPSVVARKATGFAQVPTSTHRILRPRKTGLARKQTPSSDNTAVPTDSDDPFDSKLQAITASLRDRMRYYKLHVTPDAANIASTFNEQFQPEIISAANDPFQVDWIQGDGGEVLIGDQALRIANPTLQGYIIRHPLHGGQFNTRDYSTLQLILSDIEALLRCALEKLNVESREYKNYSVLLVIPDLYERGYVREWVHLLLVTMGFKQACIQQESMAATYGAGISNACVVNIGAVTTSIACVDEGFIIPDTRMSLSMGGDDITEFLYVLLTRIGFPYRDIDLSRSYDWNVMEDLKARLCTLAEGDVALNLYDFDVRKPNKPAEKYGLRAYDEIILAPMCLFEPTVIEFDETRDRMRPVCYPDVTEDILDNTSDPVTQAMVISTRHLLPQTPPQLSEHAPSDAFELGQVEAAVPLRCSPPPQTKDSGSSSTAMEVIDVEGDCNKPSPSAPPVSSTQPNLAASSNQGQESEPFSIDVCLEASKLPLDVAIFNSARSAGGDEKIRKYLQAVLVIGGTALIPGIAHALESRLQAIATRMVPNMEKVQIIPPPKEVDPRVLVWKGAAVLGKMDGVADLWITASNWDILGMRGLKERCFYL